MYVRKENFIVKKNLIELIEKQLRKKLKLNSTKNKILKIRNLKEKEKYEVYE